jgi:hypothetical protein
VDQHYLHRALLTSPPTRTFLAPFLSHRISSPSHTKGWYFQLGIPTMQAEQQHILSASFSNSSDLIASPLFSTGSFTGFRSTLQQLGHGYLSSSKENPQPLCGNLEGWGPLSKERYDFTPCFMDVWVSTVAVYGILFGAVAVWWLVRRKTRAVVERDWCFWSKHVGPALPHSASRSISLGRDE